MEKKIRSNAIGIQGCYFLRRLAIKIWGNRKDPMHWMPSTEPSSFGNLTSSSSSTSWSSVASDSGLAKRLEQNPHLACGPDATPQHFMSTTIHQHRLHQVPVGYGQRLKPQQKGHSLGRLWTTWVHLPHATTLLGYTTHTDQPHRPRWWYFGFWRQTLDLDCQRLVAEQDLSTAERDLQHVEGGLRELAPKKLHAVGSLQRYSPSVGWLLATALQSTSQPR